MKPILFKNRVEAGKKLTEKLLKYKKSNLIIFALPRGGVPIGYEIAKNLKVKLNIIISQKLGALENKELGIGAISANNTKVLNANLINSLNISKNELGNIIKEQNQELERRIKLYRKAKPLSNLTNKIILLIDDGLATGATAEAAILSLKKLNPKKIIFAAPVCARDSLERLRKIVDEAICISCPYDFFSVGSWYKHFPQLTDEKVIKLLKIINKHKLI